MMENGHLWLTSCRCLWLKIPDNFYGHLWINCDRHFKQWWIQVVTFCWCLVDDCDAKVVNILPRYLWTKCDKQNLWIQLVGSGDITLNGDWHVGVYESNWVKGVEIISRSLWGKVWLTKFYREWGIHREKNLTLWYL